MYISYDYSELIAELEGDKAEGLIRDDTLILILREDRKDYSPIIDYYYPSTMEDLAADLEDCDEDERIEILKIQEQYKKDEPFLEQASVLAVLTEMKEYSKLVR